MFVFCLQLFLVPGAGIPIFLHLQHCTNTQQSLVKRQEKGKKMWICNKKIVSTVIQQAFLVNKTFLVEVTRKVEQDKDNLTYLCIYFQLHVNH